MAERLQFINFEQSCVSSGGNFSVQIQTINALQNVLFTMVVTGSTVGMTEAQMAFNAWPQLTTQLLQNYVTYIDPQTGVPMTFNLAYTGQPTFTSNSTINTNGFPVFNSQLGLPTFRFNVTDHVLNIFSECDYMVSIVDNMTDAIIYVSETGLLCTIAEAQQEGPINGLVLTDINGAPLSTTAIVKLIELASAKLVTFLNGNRIVICTFIHESVGNWQTSFFLRKGLPGIYFDGVWAKRPYTFALYGIFLGGSASIIWNYKRDTGELSYIPTQNCYYDYAPSGKYNEIKISYVAGNYRIPSVVQASLYTIMAAILENKGDVKSLKDGTWGVEFFDKALVEQIQEELAPYILFSLYD